MGNEELRFDVYDIIIGNSNSNIQHVHFDADVWPYDNDLYQSDWHALLYVSSRNSLRILRPTDISRDDDNVWNGNLVLTTFWTQMKLNLQIKENRYFYLSRLHESIIHCPFPRVDKSTFLQLNIRMSPTHDEQTQKIPPMNGYMRAAGHVQRAKKIAAGNEKSVVEWLT